MKKKEREKRGRNVLKKKAETNSTHEENEVSHRHDRVAKGLMVQTTDHTCGRREAVDERGVRPPEQPKRRAAQNGRRRSCHEAAAERSTTSAGRIC